MSNKIKHIFFDLDNTLWDYEKNSILILTQYFKNLELEKKFNISFEYFYQVYNQINENLWNLYRQEKVTKEDILNRRFKDSFVEVGINDSEVIKHFSNNYLDRKIIYNELNKGVEPLLEYLNDKQKYDMHVVSNGFIFSTNEKVKNTILKDYIKTITSGEELNKRKPAKEVFDLGLKKAEANPEESVFIGDEWESDILGSQNAGFLMSIHYDNKEPKKIQKEEENIYKVNNMEEIKNIL